MAQRNIHEWLEAYGESHQNKTNKLIHWICVPGIFLTIAGLLWAIPVPEFMAEVPYLNWGTLTLVPIILFYLRLSAKLAAGMTLFSIACVFRCMVRRAGTLWVGSDLSILFRRLLDFAIRRTQD